MNLDQNVIITSYSVPDAVEPPPPQAPVPPRNKTWRDAVGLHETAAPLVHLPEGLALGDDFPEPMIYDAARKRLVYRGLMYSGSYRYLRELSGDLAYLAAIDAIYINSSEANSRKRRRPIWPAIGLAAGAAALGLWWIMH